MSLEDRELYEELFQIDNDVVTNDLRDWVNKKIKIAFYSRLSYNQANRYEITEHGFIIHNPKYDASLERATPKYWDLIPECGDEYDPLDNDDSGYDDFEEMEDVFRI